MKPIKKNILIIIFFDIRHGIFNQNTIPIFIKKMNEKIKSVIKEIDNK